MNSAAPPQSLNALLALGQSRRPWDYLREVAAADPDSATAPPVRFLLAANLGSLGFTDAALELLDELDARNITGLNTEALRGPLQSKPRTALDHAEKSDILRHNAAQLKATNLPDCEASVWVSPTGAVLWRDEDRFVGCDAQAHAASAIDQTGLSPDRIPADHLPPLLIAGFSTPHLLHTLLRATRPLTNGYTPRIFVVEPDESRAARALSMLRLDDDLSGTPVAERIALFTGEDAIDQLRATLAESLECALPRSVLLDPLAPSELAEAAKAVLTDLTDSQRTAIDSELARIERDTQTLDQAAARVKAGTNLRVLIPVSRYTNFVQHSAADLAAALRTLGHEPTILAEPAPHTLLSRLGYLRAWADTNPDLVLSINHPRWRTSSALPERAPSICWVQDAMPHLFEYAAAKQGEHDFIVGYRFHELTERFGYRADRVIDAVLPVNAEKFHSGPVSQDLQRRFSCDVAFATRQSETPEAMAQRLRTDTPQGSAAAVVVDRVFEILRSQIGDDRCTFASFQLEAVARDALGDAGIGSVEAPALDEIVRLIAMPLADRLLRHQTVQRAAEICARRGWSLALYGSGWEKHPTLSGYARGELRHGEELRAAYQCAGLHLNASAHSLVHQRVIECALSGGRVLCFRRPVDLMEPRWRLLKALANREPDRTNSDGSPVYSRTNHTEVAAHFDRCGRLGVDEVLRRGDSMSIQAKFVEHYQELAMPPVDERDERLRSAIIDHASFTSRDQLEAMLEWAIEDQAEFDWAMQPIRQTGADCYSTVGAMERVLQTLAAAF